MTSASGGCGRGSAPCGRGADLDHHRRGRARAEFGRSALAVGAGRTQPPARSEAPSRDPALDRPDGALLRAHAVGRRCARLLRRPTPADRRDRSGGGAERAVRVPAGTPCRPCRRTSPITLALAGHRPARRSADPDRRGRRGRRRSARARIRRSGAGRCRRRRRARWVGRHLAADRRERAGRRGARHSAARRHLPGGGGGRSHGRCDRRSNAARRHRPLDHVDRSADHPARQGAPPRRAHHRLHLARRGRWVLRSRDVAREPRVGGARVRHRRHGRTGPRSAAAHGHALARLGRGADGETAGVGPRARGCRDAGLHHLHLHRQDRHAHPEPDGRGRGVDAGRGGPDQRRGVRPDRHDHVFDARDRSRPPSAGTRARCAVLEGTRRTPTTRGWPTAIRWRRPSMCSVDASGSTPRRSAGPC